MLNLTFKITHKKVDPCCLSSGCRKKLTTDSGLKQQKFLSYSWRPEARIEVLPGRIAGDSPLPGFRGSSSPCAHAALLLCTVSS